MMKIAKALILNEDSENRLSIESIDVPSLGPQQVLLEMQAVALNHRDQWIREGKYANIHYPSVLGSDGCGKVIDTGSEVDDSWKNKICIINPNINWGDDEKAQSKDYEVLGMPSTGTFCQYFIVDANRLHHLPGHLNETEGAALPLGGLTAYRACFHHGKLTSDHKVLVSGAGGGVAQFAAQFALHAGAELYVSSSDEQKRKAYLEMGAKGAYDYREDNWSRKLKKEGGVDLIVDSAAGDSWNDFLNIIKPGGKLVFYGATKGSPQKLNVHKMFWKQIAIQGSTMGSDQDFESMLEFVELYKIKPIISSVRPFDEIISAFDEMKEGKQFGKLVAKF